MPCTGGRQSPKRARGDGAPLEALPEHSDRVCGADGARGCNSGRETRSIYDSGSAESASSDTAGAADGHGDPSSRKRSARLLSPMFTSASSLVHHRDASAPPSVASSFSESVSDEQTAGSEHARHNAWSGVGTGGRQERGQRRLSPTKTASFLSLSSRVRETKLVDGLRAVLGRPCRRWFSSRMTARKKAKISCLTLPRDDSGEEQATGGLFVKALCFDCCESTPLGFRAQEPGCSGTWVFM